MRKYILLSTIVLAACLFTTQVSLANQKSLNVSATVIPGTPEIGIAVLSFTDGNPDNDPWTNSVVETSGNLSFGELVHTYTDNGQVKDAGVWFSQKTYAVMIYTTSFGKKYRITSNSAGLGSLPAESFVLTPVYSATDKLKFPDNTFGPEQGTKPSAAILGPTDSAAGLKTIYTSEAPGTNRILQTYYSIPIPKADGSKPYSGWKGIPLDTAPNTYSGTITITIDAV